MATIENLEERITKIEKRNREVGLSKSWEISWTRKIVVAIFTYLAIALYLQFIVGINPWINALVPTAGFLLSTLTLPFFKTLWAKYFHKQ
jgi:sterol desaturase/sphingolipid hydroxylase (fatty acid hydroxylase superfamily)